MAPSNNPQKSERSERCWTSFDKSSKHDTYRYDVDIESCNSSENMAESTEVRDAEEQQPLAPKSTTKRSPKEKETTGTSSWETQALFAESTSKLSKSEKGKERATSPVAYSRSVPASIHDLEATQFINHSAGPSPTRSEKGAPSSTFGKRSGLARLNFDKPWRKQGESSKSGARGLDSLSLEFSKLESGNTTPGIPAARASEASTPVNGFIFDDDGVAHIESDDESLNWRAKGCDYDGFFRHSDPKEAYAFEGTNTETAVNVVNGLRRARRLAGGIANASLTMTSKFPAKLFRKASEEIDGRRKKARDEGRQMSDMIKDLADTAMRAATEVASAVPPLDLQTSQAPGGKRR